MNNNDASNAKLGNINTSLAKPFRLNCKQFFLTYPQCNINKEDLLEKMINKQFIEQYVISREKHEDGNFHLHAYIKYNYKLNITNPDHFDIDGFHPNIQAVKDTRACIAYIKKDGDFIESVKLDMTTPDGYSKRKKDFNEWKQDLELEKLEDIKYPITLFENTIEKPDPSIKKRHYWFVGAPDLGKTYVLNETFENMKVYLRSNNNYPYEQYRDEDLIIFDDLTPTFAEIAAITATFKIRTQVFGNVRYNSKFWKLGHTRTIIVISNMKPQYHDLQEAFEARFNVIELGAN